MSVAQNRQYDDVVAMVQDLLGESFAEELRDGIARRRLVKRLFVLRSAQGLSQSDIAEKMGCTQSRISKLESGSDADLRLGDLQTYADALGFETRIVLTRKGRT